jgi:CheY-like chemotaxis protein
MPIMNGLEATKFIKQNWKNPPFIAGLTANVMEHDLDACYAVGMNTVLCKVTFVKSENNLCSQSMQIKYHNF